MNFRDSHLLFSLSRKIFVCLDSGIKLSVFVCGCFADILKIFQNIWIADIAFLKYPRESTGIDKGFNQLEKDSVDVLFMGASQMFSSIDAKRLTEEYGISSYDYGASRQMISTTEYYLDEALKTQHPKLVMIESCEILHEMSDDIRDEVIAYSYLPMPMSDEKYAYLLRDTGGDVTETLKLCYLPLLSYHNKWKSIQLKDISETLFFDAYADYSLRGFNPREGCNPQKMAFLDDHIQESRMLEENASVIISIAEKC